MAAWLLSTKLQIQPWHDLETIFMSFTALCLWFNTPLHAKSVDQKSDIAWIFQSQSDKDDESFVSMYGKWKMFRPQFDEKILGNLSPYFKCNAIVNLLTEMRDLCIPPSWGKEEDDGKVDPSPLSYSWPEDLPRVRHEQMLEAIEKAILTLVQDMDIDEPAVLDPVLTYDDLIQKPPPTWNSYHASINHDGIFTPPVGMEKKPGLTPVVTDGHDSTLGQINKGVFYKVNLISVDPRMEEAEVFSMAKILTAAQSGTGAASKEEEFNKQVYQGLMPTKRPHSAVTTKIGERVFKWRLN
jgi:hypothetical protein